MKKKPTGTTMDAELLEQLDALAWSVGTSRSELAERAVRAYLEEVMPSQANDDGTVLERYRKRRTVAELPTRIGGVPSKKVEKKGIEPSTSALRTQRSPN